jgi:hypothetical protein
MNKTPNNIYNIISQMLDEYEQNFDFTKPKKYKLDNNESWLIHICTWLHIIET